MEFTKIQITKKNTLNFTFKDNNGNLVTVVGANIVHKDLKQAMNALIPHIALMTEQREAEGKKLKELQADRIQDGNSRSVYKLLTVDTLTLSEDMTTVTIEGSRILQSGMVIKIQSQQIAASDIEKYEYCDDLFLEVEAIACEAEAYYKESKWGIKEGNLDFAAEDPFEGKVAGGDVPQVDISAGADSGKGKKGKSKKSKAA